MLVCNPWAKATGVAAQRKIEEAVSIASKEVEKEPEPYAVSLMVLGYVFCQSNQKKRAIQQYEKSLAVWERIHTKVFCFLFLLLPPLNLNSLLSFILLLMI